MKIFRMLLGVAPLLFCGAAGALELDGFNVPAQARIEPEGEALTLRGGYVRRYFLRATTSYALYTAKPFPSFEALVADASSKRMVVTILQPQFTAAQFQAGWKEQFAQALSQAELQGVASEMAEFIGTFETLVRGDQLAFDFVSGEGVRFSIRGDHKRTIPGDRFARALLSVWLGPRGVDEGLRRAMGAQ